MTLDPAVVDIAVLRKPVDDALRWHRTRLAELLAEGRAGGDLDCRSARSIDRSTGWRKMIILDYQLSLPQSFDRAALRERIPSVGRRFDNMPGLAAKAFLFREKGVHGSPLNQYAPFNLFADDEAATGFLWRGAEFTGVVGSYGRPAVPTWISGGYYHGPARPESRGGELDEVIHLWAPAEAELPGFSSGRRRRP